MRCIESIFYFEKIKKIHFQVHGMLKKSHENTSPDMINIESRNHSKWETIFGYN
jgi:hypothetical protein